MARRRPATGGRRAVIEWPRYNCCDGRIVQRRISWTAEGAPHDRSPGRTSCSVGGFWSCWGCPWARWGQSRAVAATAHWRLQRPSRFRAPSRDTTPAWRTAPEVASHPAQPSTIDGRARERWGGLAAAGTSGVKPPSRWRCRRVQGTNGLDTRQGDPPGMPALNGWKRRQFLALLGISALSVGSVACGAGGEAPTTPTPFAFPATRPGHDSESGRR